MILVTVLAVFTLIFQLRHTIAMYEAEIAATYATPFIQNGLSFDLLINIVIPQAGQGLVLYGACLAVTFPVRLLIISSKVGNNNVLPVRFLQLSVPN